MPCHGRGIIKDSNIFITSAAASCFIIDFVCLPGRPSAMTASWLHAYMIRFIFGISRNHGVVMCHAPYPGSFYIDTVPVVGCIKSLDLLVLNQFKPLNIIVFCSRVFDCLSAVVTVIFTFQLAEKLATFFTGILQQFIANHQKKNIWTTKNPKLLLYVHRKQVRLTSCRGPV